MNNLKIENVEFAPVADLDNETPSFYERFTVRAMATLKAKSNAVAHKNAPEADGVFQRIMGFIIGRGKAASKVIPPDTVAFNINVDEVGAPPQSECAAELRALLGSDYSTPCIKNPRQLRCLHVLMVAPAEVGISREELDNQVGAVNAPDVVSTLRDKLRRYGALIETDRRKVIADGKAMWRGFYRMSEIGRLVAQDILAEAKYVHDSEAAHRNAIRQYLDRQRLIAEFGDDQEARDAVLDVTKPHRERLIDLLLWNGGWTSRYDIERLIDAPNPPHVVMAINNTCGDEVIESETRTIIDRDGRSCNVGYYRISAEWVAKMEAAVRAAMVKQ